MRCPRHPETDELLDHAHVRELGFKHFERGRGGSHEHHPPFHVGADSVAATATF